MDINSAAAALLTRNFAKVKRYIEEGGDINARDDKDSYTLLMRAAEQTVGYTDIIGYLHQAVLADKARSVEWLLKLGANPNIGITRGYDFVFGNPSHMLRCGFGL